MSMSPESRSGTAGPAALIGAMTTATRQTSRPRWVLAFLAALTAALVTGVGAAPASAAPPPAAQNGIGASAVAGPALVGPSDHISAGQRLGNDPPQPRVVVATGVAAEDVAGASRVNALGGVNNCVNCAIAGDATLSGAPASALNSLSAQPLSILERAYGGSFKPVSGPGEIEQMLANAGSGSRGIVFGSRGADPGHVFNAVNQGGTIRFIDFRSGRAASFSGYDGFSFLWTTP